MPVFRLLALDVDGTLLNGRGEVSARTAIALEAAAKRGVRVVLCTGRRYRRARDLVEQLGVWSPLVCNSGALVKEPRDHQTLWRCDFDRPLLNEIAAVFDRCDELILSFRDDDPAAPDFNVPAFPTGRDLFDDYVSLNRTHARFATGPNPIAASDSHFHLCAIGTREGMLRFESVVQTALKDRVQTFVQKSPRYRGWMCEILRGDANKWTAVRQVAELWNIPADEICAIGDDMNDVPMLRGAGLGVAMAHAPAEVLAAADFVAPGNDQDGLAHFLESVFFTE